MAQARFPLFDADWYLARNPDVAAAVDAGLFTAEQHFQGFGRLEGRSPGPLFDTDFYLATNPDVAAAVADGLISAFDHFVNFGYSESRSPLSAFDPEIYLLHNPDVAAVVGAGLLSATEHFLLYGYAEPRQISPFIDLGAYLNANADLAAAYTEGRISPLGHLLSYGVAEGRDLGNGINLGHFSSDPIFHQARATGDFASAIGRVGDIAPFLPTFVAPAGWQAPPDTAIPVDFVPLEGLRLVIPPSVVVPPDTVLPDFILPPAPPAPALPVPPAPEPTPPAPPAPDYPELKVTQGEGQDAGIWTVGNRNGAVQLTMDGTHFVFTPATGLAVRVPVESVATIVANDVELSGGANVLVQIPAIAGNVTISGTSTVHEANAINGITSGHVTAAISDTSADTLAGLVGKNNVYSIVVTGSATAAELNAIDVATTVAVNAEGAALISGSITDFENLHLAREAGTVVLAPDFTAMITAPLVTLENLTRLQTMTNGSISVKDAVALTGQAASLSAALARVVNYQGVITVTDAASLQQATDIANALETPETQLVLVAGLKDFASAFADSGTGDPSPDAGILPVINPAVELMDDHTLAQLKAINNATTGVITLHSNTVSLSGVAADIEAALEGFAGYAGAIHVTDSVGLQQLQGIASRLATSASLSLPGGIKDATSAFVDENSGHIVPDVAGLLSGNPDVTLTGGYTLEQLITINNATSGRITLVDPSIPLSGTPEQLFAALSGVVYSGEIDVTKAVSISDARNLANTTSGKLVLSGGLIDRTENFVSASGSILPGVYDVLRISPKVELTSLHNQAQLKTLNALATGTITVFDAHVPLSGTAGDIAAVLEGMRDYGGTVSLYSDGYTEITAQQVATIAAALASPATQLVFNSWVTGSASDFVDTDTGQLTAGAAAFLPANPHLRVTGSVTLQQLKTVNASTSGSIRLEKADEPLSGNHADLLAALDGVLNDYGSGYWGEITVVDSVSIADFRALKEALSGPLVLAGGLVDSVQNFFGSSSGMHQDLVMLLSGRQPPAITLTDAHTMFQLLDINTRTTAAITLGDYSVPLSGYAFNLLQALDGISGYTGDLEVIGWATVSQAVALYGASSGKLMFEAGEGLRDSASNFADTAGNLVEGAATVLALGSVVQVTGSYTLAQLKAINEASSGPLWLNTHPNLAGTAADVLVALDGVSNFYGDIHINGNYDVAQLKGISAALHSTLSTITLENPSLSLTGPASDAVLALSRVTGYTGSVTLTTPATVQEWEALTRYQPDRSVSGSIQDSIDEAHDKYFGVVGVLGVQLSGSEGNQGVFGSLHADTIDGGKGDDVIRGLAGDDTLIGGMGADTLTGGEGADVFVYASFQESSALVSDYITDFVGGTDKIKFRATNTFEKINDDGRIAAATTLSEAVDAAYALATPANHNGIKALQFDWGSKTWFAVESSANSDSVNALVINVTGVTGNVTAADFIA